MLWNFAIHRPVKKSLEKLIKVAAWDKTISKIVTMINDKVDQGTLSYFRSRKKKKDIYLYISGVEILFFSDTWDRD